MNSPSRRDLGFRAALTFSSAGLAALTAQASLAASPPPALPISCTSLSCGPNGPNTWVTAGQATQSQNGNQLTVDQKTNQAILNWASFNIGPGASVQFKQPSNSALALNRIFDSNPSQIFGELTANGQIFLINQNGIVFGPHSQVNVNSLVASTLNISDATFSGGILQSSLLINNTPAFASDGRIYAVDQNGVPVLDANGQMIPVKITVQAGANIQTPTSGGGRIMLLGQQVENDGTLSSPGGQVVLAAGQSVYLQASTDPTLRGLVVAVDNGGAVTNGLTGQISSSTGNVTLLGLAVNQSGRISATTSVSANGSISLLAEDTHVVQSVGGVYTLDSTNSGSVELGAHSQTTVTPDTTIKDTAVDAQVQNPSTVSILGRSIHLDGGSSVVATGGVVSLDATQDHNASTASIIPVDPLAQIRIDSGASIDVSGSNVTLPMSDNILTVQLRGNELRDDPTQRDGALRGQTVYVDQRVGTTIADISGEVAAVQRTVQQRTTAGGTISIVSEGDAVVAGGATLNVSGGSTAYTGGVIATTQLVTSAGQVFDIGTADPNLTYSGVVNPDFSSISPKWGATSSYSTFVGDAHYEAGYVDGANAGTVQIAGRSLVVNGTLLGTATPGTHQRALGTQPLGGELIIGKPNETNTDFFAPSVDFRADPLPITVAPGAPLVGLLDTLELPTTYLTSGGFTRSLVYSDGRISVPAGLNLTLAPGGIFDLIAPRIDLSSSVSAPGGSIALTSQSVNGAVLAYAGTQGVFIGDAVSLDVAGRWVNDTPVSAGTNPTDAIINNGGSVAVTAGNLSIGNDVGIDVSAGAYAAPSGAITSGNAGSISLSTTGTLAIGSGLNLSGYGVNGSGGGKLAFAASRLLITHGDSPWATAQNIDFSTSAPYLTLADQFFSMGGFSTYAITANGGKITLADGTLISPLHIDGSADINATVQTHILPSNIFSDPSGRAVGAWASTGLPQSYQRLPASLSFTASAATVLNPAAAGDLLVDPGAQLRGDPGSSFAFTAPTNIYMGGAVHAPGGSISLTLSNPPGSIEQGHLPTQGIYLEPGSVLDAAGTAVFTPSALGLNTGTVLNGGKVTLLADRGQISASAGSVIDVSGSSALLDVQAGNSETAPVSTQVVASAGGSISFVAPEGILLGSTLLAHSGAAPGTAGPAGGTISIALSRNEGFAAPSQDVQVPPFPTDPRVILVGPNLGPDPSAQAVVNPSLISASGASSLVLTADDRVEFAAGTSLSLDKAISVQAPNIGGLGSGTVSLSAPVVALGPTNILTQTPLTASGGAATLQVSGDLISLDGNTALQGFGTVKLTAAADLQAIGTLTGNNQLIGSFTSGGDLTLAAAEIYPTTLSQFSISVPGGTLHTASTGASAPVLSAGGSLTLNAATIDHAGVIEAPFGQVTFNADQSLTLEPGSVVSVSANGLTIPFGQTQNGNSWVYDLVPTAGVSSGAQILNISAPPSKGIAMNGASVNVASGATVDISGGGDLYAYEFLPGLGGSRDVLSPSVSPNTYAILPNLKTYAPVDPTYDAGSTLQAGSSVYLSGIPGELAAGTYTLLPARYALLPGAYLVSVVPSAKGIQPGQIATTATGAPIISGYFTTAGTNLRDSLTTGFEIQTGSYAHQLAEYDGSLANSFFPQQAAKSGALVPQLPMDAGTLAFNVVSGLILDGSIDSKAASGGRGANVDITASQIDIVTTSTQGSGAVQLSTASLQALDAQSLLIGGTRSSTSDGGTAIAVGAQDVSLAPGATLSVPEVLLVGQNSVTIGAGAQLLSSPAASNAGITQLTLNSSTGSSALVRVSSGNQVDIVTPQSSSLAGQVNIDSGAVLSAQGSITVAASNDAHNQGTLDAHQGSLSLGASLISLGDTTTPITQGLAISDAQLALFGSLSDLRLVSHSSIDFYGDVSLGSLSAQGSASLGSLVLDASGIRGFADSSGAAQLAANSVRLTNSAATAQIAGTGTGALKINANSVELDSGSYTLSGFNAVTLASRGDLSAHGNASLGAQSDLTLSAAQIVGQGGAQLEVDASGHNLTLLATTRDPKLAAATPGLGTDYTFRANSISDGAIFNLPSGQLSMAASGDLDVAAGASLNLAGTTRSIGGVTTATPGGNVLLRSDSGNVSVAAGSTIDISGSAAGGSGGSLTIQSAGTTNLAGTLAAHASTNSTGASFTLDAGQSAQSLDALAALLGTAGFTAQQSISLGGDLSLSAGQSIVARQVMLDARGGSLSINGTIDARGSSGGAVQLSATNNVTLGAGSNIEVDATAAGGRAGSVELDTSQGSLTTLSGSRISASGGGGQVVFRAPGVGGNDVAITGLDGSIVGADNVIARVVSGYDNVSTVDANLEGAISQNLQNFGVTASNVAQRLGQSTNTNFSVQAAVELRSSGDIQIADAWDLSTLRPNGLPGELTIRAGGNIVLNGGISDGVPAATSPSWSYRLTSGADLNSANPDAVRFAQGTGGDISLGSGVAVRTGTGSIRLNAAEDVTFADQTAVIYTTGVPVSSLTPVALGNQGTLNFLTGGGNIGITAGRDIVGAPSNQIITPWQLRTNNTTGPDPLTQWGINYNAFQENVGALGGGDISVHAGRDVAGLSAVLPTSGSVDRTTGDSQIFGGGNLNVFAARDITGGVYYVGEGSGTLRAGRSLAPATSVAGTSYATQLAMGDGSLDVIAGNGLEIASVLNPTVIGQVTTTRAKTYFFTYGDESAVNLTALAGDLKLDNNFADFAGVVGNLVATNTPSSSPPAANSWYPGIVSAAALGGDIDVLGSLLLFPSAHSRLTLLAQDNVNMTSVDRGISRIEQSSAEPAVTPLPTNPGSGATGVSVGLIGAQAQPSSLHNGDSTPSVIATNTGDVQGGQLLMISPTQVIAGRDILNTSLRTDNYLPTDVTLLQAGRDISYTGESRAEITVAGPGVLELFAGRNIDLASSQGITTVGATTNPLLPTTQGASVYAFAGLGRAPDYADFVTKYLVDEDTYAKQLTAYMQKLTGDSTLTASAALTAFKNLPSSEQVPLISQVFFAELNQSGLLATANKPPGYARGYTAINTLFPGSTSSDGKTVPVDQLPYAGDLELDFSRIYTLAGGDINLFVPGGALNVGLANPPVNAPQRDPSQLGIVAQGPGSVDVFTYGDVLVNQSRIFTLDGGDIVIWSSAGNIDAGRGAKTAISAPPPQLIVNPDGTISIDFAGAVAGSGIRGILTQPDVPPGNVNLIAPVGIVNASDAGIGSAGNLNIAAQTVLGAGNINVGGTATGVPSPTFSLAAGLTSASNTANSGSKETAEAVSNTAAEKTPSLGESALSWLDVFVTGLGEENCKPDDVECLRRQKN